jgi:ATP-dependent DNA helicase DinG
MVAWVEGPPAQASLAVAPIDVGAVLTEGVWGVRTAILTSATIPPNLVHRLSMPATVTDAIEVGSPFDYANNGLLYCATHLPDPRKPGYAEALHDELAALHELEGHGSRT